MTLSALRHLFLHIGLRLELEQDQAEWPVPEKPGQDHPELNSRVRKGGLELNQSPTHGVLYLKLASHMMT